MLVRRRFATLFAVILLLYLALTCYVGLRGWEWVQLITPATVSPWLYWVPFGLIGLAFPLTRLAVEYLPRRLTDILAVVGAYWMPLFLYALPLLLIVDLARFLNSRLGLLPSGAGAAAGGAILLILVATVLYGVWRARNPVVVRYAIEIAKVAGPHRTMRVALASDTHSGTINGREKLRKMVDMVNGLEPDLVLLAGDLMDDDYPAFATGGMAEELQRLNPALGSYAILGNHDHGAGHIPEYRRLLEQAGVRLLVDEWTKVDESLCLIGRDDLSGRHYRGGPRKPLSTLMEGVDRSLPLILMDHQPYRLEEGEAEGIDLQVSGHTHRGQLFPFHLITRRTFELDWGYLRKGAMHVVVSLGFGTWGPPIRLGNRPEVVLIDIRFTGA